MGRKKYLNTRIIYFTNNCKLDRSGKIFYVGNRGLIYNIIPFENKEQLDFLLKNPMENTEGNINLPSMNSLSDQLDSQTPKITQDKIEMQTIKLALQPDNEEIPGYDDSDPILVEASITEPIVPYCQEFRPSDTRLF